MAATRCQYQGSLQRGRVSVCRGVSVRSGVSLHHTPPSPVDRQTLLKILPSPAVGKNIKCYCDSRKKDINAKKMFPTGSSYWSTMSVMVPLMPSQKKLYFLIRAEFFHLNYIQSFLFSFSLFYENNLGPSQFSYDFTISLERSQCFTYRDHMITITLFIGIDNTTYVNNSIAVGTEHTILSNTWGVFLLRTRPKNVRIWVIMFVLINQPTHMSKSVVFLCSCWWTKISLPSHPLRILNDSRWRGHQYIYQDKKELRVRSLNPCFSFSCRHIRGSALVPHKLNQQGQLMSLESA